MHDHYAEALQTLRLSYTHPFTTPYPARVANQNPKALNLNSPKPKFITEARSPHLDLAQEVHANRSAGRQPTTPLQKKSGRWVGGLFTGWTQLCTQIVLVPRRG